MLYKLALLLCASALITAVNGLQAYRRIPGRIPILPDEILNQTLPVESLDECKKECVLRGSPDLIFNREKVPENAPKMCLCLPNEMWYRHGLVGDPNYDLYTEISEDSAFSNFLFLDTEPISASRLPSEQATKPSPEECALTCQNYKGAQECQGFLFDVVTKDCHLYSKGHLSEGGFQESAFVNGVNKIYFEKLTEFELYFIPMPRTRLADGQTPREMPGLPLKNCSRTCVLDPNCLALNYLPKTNLCQLLGQTQRDHVNMKTDPDSIHFEMIPKRGCGNGRSDAKWALIRSPGWPMQLSKDFMGRSTCKWDILTPWGLTVKLSKTYFNLEFLGTCLQTLQIGDAEPKCHLSSPTYKQTSEVTRFNFSVHQWPKATNVLNERVGFLMSYSLDWTVASEMRDTGVIASPGFPKAMKPMQTWWEVVTDEPKQPVLIEFQAFNMKANDLMIDKGYLKFIQNDKVIRTCQGATLAPTCEKTMKFTGNVRLEFYSGLYNKREFPPGFKLIYSVGHSRSSLKALTGTDERTLTNTALTISEIDFQKRYESANRVIKIRNPDKSGRVELRITKLVLSGTDEANECAQDSLRVVDPLSKYFDFTFCGQRRPQGTISSFGNELHIFIKVDALPFTDKFKPERSFAIEAKKLTDRPREVIVVEDPGVVSLEESEYLPNKNIQWIIKGGDVLEPRLTFLESHLAEFKFQNHRFCDNDRLLINHGSEVFESCGSDQALSNKVFWTNSNEINITFKSDDIISGRGFTADIDMVSTSRCVPGEILKVTPNETDYLMSSNYPGVQASKSPCAWQLVAENSTGILVTVFEGEQFLSSEDPNDDASGIARSLHKKVLHLPTDSVLSWSGDQSKFLATIQDLDLTTTAAPTTPEPTTPEATTHSASTSTSTSTVLPPGFGKQVKKKNPGPIIGAGIGAAAILCIALALIIWKVRASRQFEKIEAPGEFVNSNLFQRPDEVIRNYGNQTTFDNPAFVEHRPSVNGFNHDEVWMDANDKDHRQFSHLSSNLNSLYSTQNPYEE